MNPLKKIISKQSFMAIALVMSQTISLTPLPVLAADGSVRVAGQVVFVNQAAAGGMSLDARTEAIQRNLDNALVATKDRSPSSVNIVYVKGMPVVTLGGFTVVTVDSENARRSGSTPAVLAKRWADTLRNKLTDRASIESYVAQLSGDYQASAPAVANNPAPAYGADQSNYGQAPGAYPAQYAPPTSYVPQRQYPVQQGRVMYAPAGLNIPVTLQTSIATNVAKPGDLVQATINSPIQLGESSIPAGSTVVGTITDAKAGGFLTRSGMLSIKFNRLRTPDGVETPMAAHISGGIGKYTDVGNDQSDIVRGETWKTKLGKAALGTAIGAGTGAALGTAVGAIASHGSRVGTGAWSGTAIGAGTGAAYSLLLRKGKDVTIPSGTQLQVQLDAPMTVSGAPYSGTF